MHFITQHTNITQSLLLTITSSELTFYCHLINLELHSETGKEYAIITIITQNCGYTSELQNKNYTLPVKPPLQTQTQ